MPAKASAGGGVGDEREVATANMLERLPSNICRLVSVTDGKGIAFKLAFSKGWWDIFELLDDKINIFSSDSKGDVNCWGLSLVASRYIRL